MVLKYVSGSTGKEVDLSGGHIKARIRTAGFYDYEYEAIETELASGIVVDGFTRGSKKYELILDFRGNKEERAEAAEDFFATVNRDVETNKQGRLYFKGSYLVCNVISSKYENAGRARIVRKTAGVYAPRPTWVTEEKKSLLPGDKNAETEENYLDYEHDYEFDYATMDGKEVIWEVDHYAPAEFEMIIYGACTDPRITINGHTYQVYTTVGENDYIKVNSRDNSVIKYLNNGTQQDIYDYRAKNGESLFEPIEPGSIRITWAGDFGIDITLFCERSEPSWKAKSS